jgi:16S rRNA processing protein RimM
MTTLPKKKISSIRVRPPRTTTPPGNAGTVAGLFGLRGECKVEASRLGADALAPGLVLHATLRDGRACDVRVESVRFHKGRPLVRFAGYADATAAEALVGARLAVDAAAIELRDGEYLDTDLIGCMLVDESGKELGAVVDVAHHAAQDLLVVGERRAYVPLVRAFVRDVNLRTKRIAVSLPAGLLDDEHAERA